MSRVIFSTAISTYMFTMAHQVSPLEDSLKRSLMIKVLGQSLLSGGLNAPPPSQPSAPDMWFGREKIVSSLADIITGKENPKLAILGAGGMGKTSTALHVIYLYITKPSLRVTEITFSSLHVMLQPPPSFSHPAFCRLSGCLRDPRKPHECHVPCTDVCTADTAASRQL